MTKQNIHHADLCGEAGGKYSNHCFKRLNFGAYMGHLLDSENGKWESALGQLYGMVEYGVRQRK